MDNDPQGAAIGTRNEPSGTEEPVEAVSQPLAPQEVERYLQTLNEHILTSRLALHGEGDEHPNEWFRHTTSTIPPHDEPWSPCDKAAFFASLSRHSRWRTDLIAGDVGKSENEVIFYLEILEMGSRAVARSDASTRGFRDRSSRWNRSHRWQKGSAPGAVEVTEEGVAKEESLAEQILVMEVDREKELDHLMLQETIRQAKTEKVKESVKRRSRLKLDDFDGPARVRSDAEEWGLSLDEHKLGLLDRALEHLWSKSFALRSRNTALDEKGSQICGSSSLSKPDQIVVESERIATLQAIPKKERTKAERTELSAMLNRKNNREKYRIKQLLAEGMTMEQIQQQGGADEIFRQRKGEPMQGNFPAKPDKEEMDGIAELRRCRVHILAEEKGWDVFNFARIKEIASRGDHAELCFRTLEDLRAELISHLAEIVLHAIVIGEAEAAQEPTEQGVSLRHIDQAVALQAQGRVAWRTAIHHDLSNVEDPSTRRYRERQDMVQSPFPHTWTTIALSTEDDDPLVEVLRLDRFQYTITDDEESELDEAMDAMDQANDNLYEAGSWEAPAKSAPGTKKRKRERAGHDEEAIKAYKDTLARVLKARRWRHAIERRSKAFPTTRRRIEGGRMRSGKNEMVVLDSDDEELAIEQSSDDGEGEHGEGADSQAGSDRERADNSDEFDEDRHAREDSLESEERDNEPL